MSQRIDTLTIESLADLTSVQLSPCLSLYQSTHRSVPEKQQDTIRFRNLVKGLDGLLRQNYPEVNADIIMQPFVDLSHDDAFWNQAQEGMAMLAGPGLLRVFRLQRPVAELAVVASNFHVKPLRRLLQSIGQYQVLGVSLKNIQLFEGNRDSLDEIAVAPGVPRTMIEALGSELTEPHQIVASYGGVGQGSYPMHSSYGGKKDEVDGDAEKFFRAVDRAVLEHHSRPSGLPLILAALPQHHALFRRVSQNPFLIANGLKINPGALSKDALRVRAWKVVEPQYKAQLAALSDEFEQARSEGLGNDDLSQVAKAASIGRVATLLIEADRQLDGRLDQETGRVEVTDRENPHGDDVLDDLGELVERLGGKVVSIPSEQMPVQTGLAATYRY